MIRSDAELEEFREKMRAQERRLVEYRAELEARGLPDADIQQALAPVRAFAAKLQNDVSAYERLARGELPAFVGIEQLGDALVAARLVVGVSQRELAARLGVNESIIS